MADEDMVQNAVEPQDNHKSDEVEWENDDDAEKCNEVEFEALNAEIDQLNSVLDNLESKNDNIHAELIELLQSNREARRQFQDYQNDHTSESTKSDV